VLPPFPIIEERGSFHDRTGSLGTFYTGYKGTKSSHKYFAASSLLCMIMAIYTGHKMISKNKKTKKEPISLGNEE